MNEEVRRRFESIFQLYALSWQQFNTRRTYEWQVTISIWTALALAIAGVSNIREIPKILGGIWTLLSFGIMIVFLQVWWCRGIANGNKIDRLIAFHYEAILQNISNSEFSVDLKNKLKPSHSTFGKIFHWNYMLQIGVSALLIALLIVIVWSKSCGVPTSVFEDQKIKAEITKLQLENKTLETQLNSSRVKGKKQF